MKAKTTIEQREAWKKVHVALSEYYNNFGPIVAGTENNFIYLNWDSRYVECGKIYCPNNNFSLDKKESI